MKPDKNLKFEGKSVFKLDPLSERYRVCPECVTPFMTRHLGRDFCCKKHANDYNNRNKRLAKHAIDVIASPLIPENRESIPEQISSIVPIITAAKFESGIVAPIKAEAKTTNNSSEESLEKKKIIDSFAELLADKQEVKASWTDLIQKGINLKVCVCGIRNLLYIIETYSS